MAIVRSSHSSGDAMTNFSNTIEWINTKHDSSRTLLDTFDTINIGGAQIAATFGNSDGLIDPATLISLISIFCLPPAFRGLLEATFFRNTPRYVYRSYHNSNYDDQPSSQGQSYVATQGGPPVSPKLYCLHCYSRTGNKYPSHGYPGKPPYNHIPSAASPTHVPSAAPAPQTKPYAQSYISAPVPPQTH
jgi:hypothetical protein